MKAKKAEIELEQKLLRETAELTKVLVGVATSLSSHACAYYILYIAL